MTKNEIINLIPSKDLRKAIIESSYELSDELLFKIAYIYSPNVEARIKVCADFIGSTSNSILRANIKEIHDHLINGISILKKEEPNTIYEIRIKEKGACSSRYLATSYDDAYIKLQALIECNYKDNDILLSKLEISILKRGIYKLEDEHFEDDVIEVMWFNDRLEPNNLYFPNAAFDDLSADSDDLIDAMTWEYDDLPAFFSNGDLVKFNDSYGNDSYGIVIKEPGVRIFEAIAYVVRFEQLTEEDYIKNEYGCYKALNIHTHVPYTELLLADPKELDKKRLKSYNRFMKFFKSYCLNNF